LIHARDRFKHSIIVDIPELGVKLFGEKSRVWVSMVPIVMNLLNAVKIIGMPL